MRGRFNFPDDDPRPLKARETTSIMDYHKDYIHNENGYENFVGLVSYFLRSKYNNFHYLIISLIQF